MKEIIISKNEEHQRLDKFLKKFFPSASAGFLYKMLRKKNITLNEKKASGEEKLSTGDRVLVFFSDETFEKMRGQNENEVAFSALSDVPFDVDVIFEDTDLLVLNKPAGVLSQKAKRDDVSINEMALSYLIHKGEVTEESFALFHPSIANRLDRNTSGILLFGKTLKGMQYLSAEVRDRSAKKYYLTIVKGEITSPMSIDGYLKKDETTNKVSIQQTPCSGAKYIKTAYVPLASSRDRTLLRIHLITGRSHQIRAHLASISHPILGDFKYGDASLNQKYHCRTQMLHAEEIILSDGRVFVAKAPEAFVEQCKRMGLHGDMEIEGLKGIDL